MGSRQSRVVQPEAPTKEEDGGFTVSVTPGLVSSLQKGSNSGGVGQGPAGRPEVVTTKEEAEEVAAAYRNGLKDAEANLRHHLVTQKEQWTQELLEREARLAEYISVAAADFKSRKFVPPSRPIACEEEAEQMVACYREKGGKEGGKEGGVVKGCNGLVDLYEKCARKVVQGLEVRQ
ncbi:Hypothetical protein NocV09_02400860 [Nannochloropsis oceanica]